MSMCNSMPIDQIDYYDIVNVNNNFAAYSI